MWLGGRIRVRIGVVLFLTVASGLAATGGHAAAPCSVPSTHVTIQAAINDSACDPITVADGTYAESLTVNRSVTLIGVGPGATTIDPSGTSSDAISINNGLVVTVESMTLTGGGRGIMSGNGILNARNLVIEDNTSPSLGGAGIFLPTGGTLTLENSTLRQNQTGAINDGGAINSQSATSVTIRNTTMNGNSALGHGGAIHQLTGTMHIVNSTFNDNDANDHGGALYVSGATTQVSSTTVTGNTADLDESGSSANGGGIQVSSGTLTIRNSIVAGNTDASTAGDVHPDCSGSITSAGYNLIQNTAGCSFTPDNDVTGQATGLGPLTENGGPTETQLPAAGSPAIDGGNPAGCTDGTSSLATDQRGQPRSLDGNGDGQPQCDIGAAEAEVPFQAKALSLRAKPKKVEPGGRTRLIAQISPCVPGTANDEVEFRRGSKLLATKAVDEDCEARKKVKVEEKTRFRASSPADPESGEASDKVKVKVKG